MDLEKHKLTPLDQVISRLKKTLLPLIGEELSDAHDIVSKILSRNVFAELDNPPFDNSAIDGFGIKAGKEIEVKTFNVLESSSVPGVAFTGKIKENEALRVLTGAEVPSSINKIIFDEETLVIDNCITLTVGPSGSSNIRFKGEDIKQGQLIFSKGHLVSEKDIASLIASGNSKAFTYKRLRIGLLKTGTEIRYDYENKYESSVIDANGVPLTALLNKWGFEVIQLGNVSDDAGEIKERLSTFREGLDAIVTTGGASSGEEDYVSKLLINEGEVYAWKVAIKPGRPIIMGNWQKKFFFGLPGNPVAAFVCALIFLRPALGRLAGERLWFDPLTFRVKSSFKKTKKIGRTEFLRGRLGKNNSVSIYPYEGSGRLTSLAWSNGLVRLDDKISKIDIGDEVTFIPYSSFQ